MTLSNTVRSNSSLRSWNTTPTLRRRMATPERLSLPTSWPLTTTRPSVGRSMAGIMRSRVLLPAPEWPDSTTISPLSTVKLTPLTASMPPG